MNPKLNAKDILSLLSSKHSSDVFVSECKTGSTWARDCLRLDAWVMKRTWSPVTSIGYEIKVNRQDFLRDTKFIEYKKYCNMLYFVCPYGLIDKVEVPEGVGLMYISRTGTKLYTKVKAAYNSEASDSELMRYILMSRADIRKPAYRLGSEVDKNEAWSQWLVDRDTQSDTGRKVAKVIHDDVSSKCGTIMCKNKKLENEIFGLRDMKEFVDRFGIDIKNWNGVRNLKSEIHSQLGSATVNKFMVSLANMYHSAKDSGMML